MIRRKIFLIIWSCEKSRFFVFSFEFHYNFQFKLQNLQINYDNFEVRMMITHGIIIYMLLKTTKNLKTRKNNEVCNYC